MHAKMHAIVCIPSDIFENMKHCMCVVADWEAKERQAQAEKEEAEFNKRRDAEVREKSVFTVLTVALHITTGFN